MGDPKQEETMADDAVMDAAVDTDVQDTSADTGLDTESEESTSDTQIAEAEHPDQPDKITTPELKLIDGGKLSADAKKHLEELKTTNPPLAKALYHALYRTSEMDKLFPGGVKEVQQLRQTIETLGGENGIQDIQAEVNGWHQFDEQYMAGDPKAIDFMTSEPEGREAFLKLIPSALAKYEELHPEGFTNYMAQVIVGTMGKWKIDLAMAMVGRSIKDNPEAQEYYSILDNFTKSMEGMASKQVQAPKFQAAAPDNERAQFEQERSQFQRQQWQTETTAEAQRIAKGEVDRLLAGRKLSDKQITHILSTFELKMNAVVQQKYKDTFDRYHAAKDKEGFLRYASQVSKTEIPRVLRDIFDATVPQKPGPRPGSAPPPIKNGAPAKGVPIAAGFTQVPQRPDYKTEVDLRNPFNNGDNMRKGLAILKDGRKVRWAVQA